MARALHIARHRRFAWIEYEDHRDGVMFASTFSSTKLGWINLLEDLPPKRAVEPVPLLDPLSVIIALFLGRLLTIPLKLPGDRIDQGNPLMDIRYLTDPAQKTAGRVPQALILRPGISVDPIFELNGQPKPDLTSSVDMAKAIHAIHHDFLGKWLLNPGVKKVSAAEGRLTFGDDFTDQADLVAVSGHGGGGA